MYEVYERDKGSSHENHVLNNLRETQKTKDHITHVIPSVIVVQSTGIKVYKFQSLKHNY